MELVRANKYRLYPTVLQKILLHEIFSSTRFVFNNVLGKIQESYFGTYIVKNGPNKGKEVPNIPNQTGIVGFTTKLKEEYPFLNKIPNDFLQGSLSNLYMATKGFYKGGGFPKFKSRKNSRKNFVMKAGSRVRLKDGYVVIPNASGSNYTKDLLRIKYKQHKTNYAIDLKNITGYCIEKDNLGHYYISITHKVPVPAFTIKGYTNPVGIDLGLKDLAILSDGTKIPNDNLTKKSSRKLARAQRALSKKKKGSRNRTKSKRKVAKVYKKISNQRRYRNHNLSRKLVNLYDFIALESLVVKNMIKNPKLSKAIANVAWSDLVSKIQYKQAENQGVCIKIDTFYPSSKTCSCCGNVKKELKLEERIYSCTECYHVQDRDVNASINILNEGLRIYNLS